MPEHQDSPKNPAENIQKEGESIESEPVGGKVAEEPEEQNPLDKLAVKFRTLRARLKERQEKAGRVLENLSRLSDTTQKDEKRAREATEATIPSFEELSQGIKV